METFKISDYNLKSSLDWPDVKDRETLLSLAKMSNDAYIDSNDTDWYNTEPSWRVNGSFGWDLDGMRGYVFGNQDNSLLVIAFKGASAGLWGGGTTGEKDKANANVLFSCCCAMLSRFWTPVCDCYEGNEYICEERCLQRKLSDPDFYYIKALNVYNQIQQMNPHSKIWITGHSVGGALASLVGQTYGVPAITFGSPGDQLASSKLHLPHSIVGSPIWHFGHTGDPIFTGECVGFYSSCWAAGYAMESKCHTGKMCVWDTVKNNGWGVDIKSHRIKELIEKILMNPQGFPLPDCIEETDCQDCSDWSYYDQRDKPDALY